MLIGTAIELMADVVRPIGTMLTKLPVGPAHPDSTAGMAFQMHYAMGNFVPWRESAWALLHERMTFLVERCTSAGEHAGAPDVVHAAGERVGELSAKLAAHVPVELRGVCVTAARPLPGDIQRDPGRPARQSPQPNDRSTADPGLRSAGRPLRPCCSR